MKNKDSLRLLFWFAFAVASVALLFGLASCKTQRQVHTEYVYIDRTDTLTQFKWRIDSINVHDSIITLIKGDTIQIEKWHTAYRERLRVDTVERLHTETIYQTNIETKIEEVNRLLWWQKTLMWIGGIGLTLAIVAILVAILTIRRWLKGK